MEPGNNKTYKEISLSIEEAGHLTLKMVMPFFSLFAIPFFMIHGFGSIEVPSLLLSLVFFISLIAGVVIHELIHALFFVIFNPVGIKNITFGFHRKTLSPFCHPKGNFKVWVYRIGALAPLVILGVLPTLVSFYTGCFWMFFWGFIFSVSSGGDIISVWLTRKLKPDVLIKDHESKLGFYIIEKVGL